MPRDALRLAHEEAKTGSFDYVGVAHYLIALLKLSPVLRALCKKSGHEPRLLRAAVRSRLGAGVGGSKAPEVAEKLLKLVERAVARAKESDRAGELEVLAALSEERTGVAGDIVKLVGLGDEPLDAISDSERVPASEPRVGPSKTPMLDRIARDLSALAKAGALPPFIGRKDLIKRVLVALSRQTKPNVLLVGEAGVGKTAVAEGLAHRVAEGKVPPAFLGLRLLAVEPSALAAGASLVGESEKRMRQLVTEASSDPNIVLFMDEMHTLMGIGHSAMNAGDILKPALARGEIRVIGATTPGEFARFLERDAAIARRFEKIEVTEPSPADAVAILMGMRERLEKHHALTIDDAAIEAAVHLSVRYLPARHLPDKAIDLVDEACGRARMGTLNVGGESLLVVTRHAIAEVVAEHAGVSLEELSAEDRKNLLDLEARLAARIVGQKDAVTAVARSVQSARVGLKPEGRPIGAFLLTGPSGVGKTALAEAIAELAFGKGALLRIDLSEYQHSHELSRLVGAPPGYVGHDRDGVLTGGLKKKPHSVVLFDEADKGHPGVFDLLLQVLDEGRISDGRGETVDCTQALFLLTSNHLDAAGTPKRRLGFGVASRDEREREDGDSKEADRDALLPRFRPEFLGRLDAVLKMKPLSPDAMREVASKLLDDALSRLTRLRVTVTVESGVLEALARSGDDKLGARPMRAVVEREVLGPAGELLLRHGAPLGLVLGVKDGRLHVREGVRESARESEGEP